MKYCYLRCIDLKLWDEIGEVFTDDATLDYGTDGRWRIAHTGYVRTYEAMVSLDDLPSFKIIAALGNGQAVAGAAPSAPR